MATHLATVEWTRTGPDFLRGKYSREHTWTFDGGVTVLASPAPAVVPAPYSNEACIDPEEALVAALASCHMLTFLWLASKRGFQVDGYRDEAVGELTKNERGVPWVSRITLRPAGVYSGERQPTADEELELHRLAHEQCYIANTVKSEVVIRPVRGDVQ